MHGDELDRLDTGDLDSLEIVELTMALEGFDVDPSDADSGDESSLVRNRPPQRPSGSSGAAVEPEDQD
jgi:hypothetical protein